MLTENPRRYFFLSLLALPQLVALGAQLAHGFRPFHDPPTRIAFSWDMFAIPIDRCHVSWNPPLSSGTAKLATLAGMTVPLEWDPVFDHEADYLKKAATLCRQWRSHGNHATLTCFSSRGTTTHHALDCP